MKLVMQRRGSFRCNWASTENKCGVGPDFSPEYQYLCRIETSDEVLDKHGFIIDQLEIDKYFQEKYNGHKVRIQAWTPPSEKVPAISCERIAVNAVKDVKRMVENHMLGALGTSVLYRIAVTVSFGQEANLTAEWVPEKAKPIANVKKLKMTRGLIS